jgi:hypothetical protein
MLRDARLDGFGTSWRGRWGMPAGQVGHTDGWCCVGGWRGQEFCYPGDGDFVHCVPRAQPVYHREDENHDDRDFEKRKQPVCPTPQGTTTRYRLISLDLLTFGSRGLAFGDQTLELFDADLVYATLAHVSSPA